MHMLDPRFTAVLPTTARLAAPFVPKSLDPARLRREQEAALDRDSAEIDKEEKSFLMTANYLPGHEVYESTRAQFKARREANAEHRNNLEKAHRELAARVMSPPTFMLRVPTPLDRDQLQSRLIEMGAQAIGQEQLRATMINAIFDHDWSDGRSPWTAEQNEQVATDNADFLDGLWQIEEAHDRAMREWQEQEAERILDQWNGAPKREGDHKPRRLISVRDSAKQTLLLDRMMQTPAMRSITSKQVDYERRHKMILVRISLAEVTGVPSYTAPALVQAGLWDEVEIEALRQAMDDAYGPQLSQLAWDELVDRVARAYTLDGFEEKNSDLPLGNTTDLNSSVGPSGASESSDGISTASSSSPIPSDVSAPTTEKLSDYGSDYVTQMVGRSGGQTDAGSLISPSS